MRFQNTIKFVAAYALFIWANGIFAQSNAPYAGQQTRSIKALSRGETQDLLDGKGMGLAKAAELNGYPGPMHVLELARRLQLSPAQREASEQLMAQHKAQVRQLGAQLVQAEALLDAAFATRQITPEQLTQHTQRIGQLQAAVRTAHLQTHLAQTALLQPEQIAQYNTLRGYTPARPHDYSN